jgi:hypothetical protein
VARPDDLILRSRCCAASRRMGHNKSADAHLQSRGVNCPSCAGKASLKEKQRAQGKPGARCTRSRVCSVESTRVSHHRFTGTPGLPCAMVLTVSFVLSPVTGLCCHRRLAENSAKLDASVGASGPHDFAVRVSDARHAPLAASIASRTQRS